MKIVNINYRGKVTCPLSQLKFKKSMKSPQMLKFNVGDKMKLLVFRSGKCRLMGCKEAITRPIKCEVPYMLTSLMSITITFDVGQKVNLYKLARHLGSKKCMFEPELFPAARLLMYNPTCVNVFYSGKVVVLGLKTFTYNKQCADITELCHQFSVE